MLMKSKIYMYSKFSRGMEHCSSYSWTWVIHVRLIRARLYTDRKM